MIGRCTPAAEEKAKESTQAIVQDRVNPQSQRWNKRLSRFRDVRFLNAAAFLARVASQWLEKSSRGLPARVQCHSFFKTIHQRLLCHPSSLAKQQRPPHTIRIIAFLLATVAVMTIDMTRTSGAKKTIAVLGASYAGHRAIQVLVASLSEDWRVVVLERNTHANHLYAFPRMSVVRGHEHKVFIPYTNMFQPALGLKDQHVLLHANVIELDRGNRRVSYELIDDKKAGIQWLHWDYLVYALGSHLPDPINVWSNRQHVRQYDGSKLMGVQWLRDAQDRIEAAKSIVIVGGGALGVGEYTATTVSPNAVPRD